MAGTAKTGWVRCENCDDTGVVCENHPNRPFTYSRRFDACECGAGMPCEFCNEPGEMSDPARAFMVVTIDENGPRH